jgi:hypothetical protein
LTKRSRPQKKKKKKKKKGSSSIASKYQLIYIEQKNPSGSISQGHLHVKGEPWRNKVPFPII